MNEFLLKGLDLLSPLIRSLRVNYPQLRAIVSIKLTMDNRRQIISYRRKNENETSHSFLRTLFFCLVFGGFVSLAMAGIPSFLLSMLMYFSYIMVVVSMTLITDFSSILLDTSDNTIILPRPVDSRTMFAARLTHILLYLAQLTIALTLIPSIVVGVRYGLTFFITFEISTILAVITAVLFTNFLYLLILQFSSEEKLKNVINYFQIVMAVFIMGGYQVLPRIANRMNLNEYDIQLTWWSAFIPPAWMAGTMEMVYIKQFDSSHIIFSVLSLAVPLAGFYIMSTFLIPIFNRKLGVMGTATASATRAESGLQSGEFVKKISRWFTTDPTERGSFETIFRILGRDRKIKLKIYPTFGYIIVFGFIFIFNGKEDLITVWNNLPETKYHLLLIYLAFMIVQVAIFEIPYSDDYKASWIFSSSPIQTPGEVLLGTLKAIFARLFLPAYIAVCIVVVAIWGVDAIDDIIFGLFNNCLMLLVIAFVGDRHLPVSMPPNLRNQTGTFVRNVIMLIVTGAIGAVHYLLAKTNSYVLLGLPVQLVLIYFLQQAYRRTSWEKITL